MSNRRLLVRNWALADRHLPKPASPIVKVATWWLAVVCRHAAARYARSVKTDLLIDGMLSGTGVRDVLEGGYLQPKAIGLSTSLMADISDWQRRYEHAHFAGFSEGAVAKLDEEGLALRLRVQTELPEKSVGYFSNGKMTRLA